MTRVQKRGTRHCERSGNHNKHVLELSLAGGLDINRQIVGGRDSLERKVIGQRFGGTSGHSAFRQLPTVGLACTGFPA